MLGDLVELFCRWLLEHGFSRYAVRKHLANVSHFDAHLRGRAVTIRMRISPKDITGFFRTFPLKSGARRRGQKYIRRVRYSINRFVECLREVDLFESSSRHDPYQMLLDAYTEWMRNYQAASPGTIQVRRHSLTQFLIWLGPKATAQGLSQLTPDTVERFFLSYAQNKGRAARRSMQSALRTFFRFCLHQGHIGRLLDRAVPTLRTYKLATLPCGLTEVQARKVLKCPDRATSAGRRD